MRLLLAAVFCLITAFTVQAQATKSKTPLTSGSKSSSTEMYSLTVDGKANCLVVNANEFNKASSIKLTKGTYVARISSGAISNWSQKSRAIPFACISIGSGLLKTYGVEGEKPLLWAGLEGYSDTFTFEVVSKEAKFSSFVVDSRSSDNVGSVTVTITKQ